MQIAFDGVASLFDGTGPDFPLGVEEGTLNVVETELDGLVKLVVGTGVGDVTKGLLDGGDVGEELFMLLLL